MGESEPQNRHSRQAYIIIKTIHLMNFANADTLAPIAEMLRSEMAGASGNYSFSLSRSKKRGKLARQFRPEGRLKESGWVLVGAPGLLCDSDKA
ncbi:MAG TPA: hypothetical protein VJX30_14430 [Terriglobales bacterium]|jgi:hypothetical protein|nr:hypothetical protein [Terriglobales bacterium]